MAREPTQQIPLNAELQPVATPVDTFVQPAKSPLRGLADSLSTLNGPLQDFMDAKNKKDAANQAILGKAAIYGEHSGELAEAVRTGVIPPQYSPIFMENYKQAQGEQSGGQLIEGFDAAFNAWDGKNSDDPKAYDNFLADYLKTNIKTQDPHVLAGLLPKVQELENNARQRYIAYKADQTYNGNLNSTVGMAMQDVTKASQDGLSNPKGADYKTLWESNASRRAAFIAQGGKADDFDKTYVEGLSAKIMELQDPSLLDGFNQTIPGTDQKYIDRPDFLKVKNATLDALEAKAHEQLTQGAAQAKAQQTKLKDDAIGSIVRSLAADPKAPVDEKMLQQAEQNGEPTIRTKLKEWGQSFVPAPAKADGDAVQALQQKMVDNPDQTQQIITDALNKGIFKGDPEGFSAFYKFGEGLKDNADKITTAINSPSANRIIESIGKRASERNQDTGDLINGLSHEALSATYDFKYGIKQFIIDNPNATKIDIDEFVQKQGDRIMKNLQLPADGDPTQDAFKYNRDPNLKFPGLDGQQPPGSDGDGPDSEGPDDVDPNAQPPAGQQQQGSVDVPGQNDPETVKKAVGLLDPDQRKIVEGIAKQKNQTVEQTMHDLLAPADAAGVAKKISYNPAEDLGENDGRANGLTFEKADGVISEALARASQNGGDTGANLKQLIYGSESGGNYNAVYGNMKSTRDLSQYTVDDILKQQEQARANGLPSTAIGIGQIKYSTLKSLKAEMGLSGSEKFTPELQDHLVDGLLNRRGLQEFKAGKLSQRQFALRLSQEWAALPNPNTGRSFYSGDGLNAAQTHVGNVYAAMGLPVSYDPSEYGGKVGPMTFDHPEQAAGVKTQLKGIVSSAFADIGVQNPEIMSGYRGPDHPVEAAKPDGPGEHSKGDAMDVSMKGLTDQQRALLVQSLREHGAKRFITYSKQPDMLHVDLKDQTGNGSAYFMHDKSAKNLSRAPGWFKNIAFGTTDT